MDYDPPWMHEHKLVRKMELKFHFDFYWAREIARNVKKEGYDTVFSLSERVSVPLAPMVNGSVKQLTIIINTRSPKWLSAIKLFRAHQRWDKIITYSRAEAEDLQREFQLGPEKVVTIHNYVDTHFFKETEKADLEQDSPFIFSQGLTWRDYPTLIRAMRDLSDVTCHISAKSAWDVNANFDGLEIPANVQMKPYDHPSLIRDAFSKCRFFVLPLRVDAPIWASGSTSVLQAQAMGNPVIVSYLPGIVDYVKDGETGIVVKGNDPKALAEAIDYLWKNPDKAEEMGRRGQAWVLENFTLEHWLGKVVNLLESLA
jgi:glycosyltransferase involved in cell wall biosynthesis